MSWSLLEAIRQRCPAAIMLDVKLRGKSGLEILKGLKAYNYPGRHDFRLW